MEKTKFIEPGGVYAESYILRLYRREQGSGEPMLLGVLEEPLSGQRCSFRSMEELHSLLNALLRDKVNKG